MEIFLIILIIIILLVLLNYYLNLIQKTKCDCIIKHNLNQLININKIFILLIFLFIIIMLIFIEIMKKKGLNSIKIKKFLINFISIFFFIMNFYFFIIIVLTAHYTNQIKDCDCLKFKKINYVILGLSIIYIIYDLIKTTQSTNTLF
jgi:hypothetical protein